MYNAAWPCRGEPKSDHAVPTAAQLESHLITGQQCIQVLCYRKSACKRKTTGLSWRKSDSRRTTLQGRRNWNLIRAAIQQRMEWCEQEGNREFAHRMIRCRGKPTSSVTWKLLVLTQGCPSSVRALAVSEWRTADRSRPTVKRRPFRQHELFLAFFGVHDWGFTRLYSLAGRMSKYVERVCS